MSESDDTIDWTLTTYEGNRRAQIRRAAEMPFDRVLEVIEEMEELATELAGRAPSRKDSSERRSAGDEP